MTKTRFFFVVTSFFFLLNTHVRSQNRPTEKPLYSIFLIGDAGSPGGNPTLDLLSKRLQSATTNSGLIFLGDNIYDNGMPPADDKNRPMAEAIINSQIAIAAGFKGDVFFIPGNHDWDNGKKNGWRNIQEQEQYIENALDSADVFFPSNGCPGPNEIPLTEKLVLIILDTQYFLHNGEKPGRSSSCGAKTSEEAFLQLKDIIDRNINKKIIVASHHPIYTKGMHGGVVTSKDHLFPLTKISPNLWIPLPIIGSLFPIYRQTIGSIQDQANLQHKAMVKAINDLLKDHNNILHVSGHEHALQHLAKDNVNYVVSGSGSKQNTTVKEKNPSLFAGNYHGFGRLDFYNEGQVWLTFESPDTENSVVYDEQISQIPFVEEFDPEEYGQFSIVPRENQTARASTILEGGDAKRFFFGEGYRKEWYQSVEAPVFDVGKELGGLKILKRGGGNQTISLRLEDSIGKQYVIRLLEKDASKLIPEEFRSNFVKKAVQEGISGSNPYAGFVVPPLADAVDVYHTNPRLIYLPDDPRFGIYREDLKYKLALFEERPAKDRTDVASFGNSEKIISTQDLLDALYKDNDNHVDQQSLLRARLFDTFLGDWDRHDDQWRWARFEAPDKGYLYRPIPRDRDQVFFKNTGLIPGIIGATWAVPALQGFDSDIKSVTGLWSFAARYFDRSFLTELERQDWVETAKQMQKELTDEVIENAIKSWPQEIYQHHGDEIIAKLKARRNNLVNDAEKYYEALAKNVDIVGSNKNEAFMVRRINKDSTEVTVHKLSKNGDLSKMLYRRIFISSETKEINLYGLKGDDYFFRVGSAKKGPLVRVIGGEGSDLFDDKTAEKSIKNSWFIYDRKEGTVINKGSETKNKTSNNPNVNIYNRQAFNYNKTMPLAAIKYNPDDGLFLGVGASIVTHGFRKYPFKSKHNIGIKNALGTSSYSFGYSGEFTDVLGKTDFLLTTEIRSPNYVTNFFGIGNESEYDQTKSIDYYRVRFEEMLFDAMFRFNFSEDINLQLGSATQNIEVEPTPERFITDIPNNGLNSTVFARKLWTGIRTQFEIDTRDKKVLTERGVMWRSSAGYYVGLQGGAGSYSDFSTDLTLFYSFKQPSHVTLSNRIGYAEVWGSPEFYQLKYLDGHDQLRGFRKYRFSGERIFYNNINLDIKLLYVKAYVLPTQIGIKLFYDVGKTWVTDEPSDLWHHAYGGAFWIAPARIMNLSLLYGRSREGWYPSVQFTFALD